MYTVPMWVLFFASFLAAGERVCPNPLSTLSKEIIYANR
jgi:hypothetical protein